LLCTIFKSRSRKGKSSMNGKDQKLSDRFGETFAVSFHAMKSAL